MTEIKWHIYLSGEIHSNWRAQIIEGIKKNKLPIQVSGPITDHQSSDSCGTHILGEEPSSFWSDHKSAKINYIRNKRLIEEADIIIVKFGEKYRQWNASFEAGYANAIGTPIITMHSPDLTHALKEIDAVALAVTETPEQTVKILQYVSEGQLL